MALVLLILSCMSQHNNIALEVRHIITYMKTTVLVKLAMVAICLTMWIDSYYKMGTAPILHISVHRPQGLLHM